MMDKLVRDELWGNKIVSMIYGFNHRFSQLKKFVNLLNKNVAKCIKLEPFLQVHSLI